METRLTAADGGTHDADMFSFDPSSKGEGPRKLKLSQEEKKLDHKAA